MRELAKLEEIYTSADFFVDENFWSIVGGKACSFSASLLIFDNST